jgi:hypothetical protein
MPPEIIDEMLMEKQGRVKYIQPMTAEHDETIRRALIAAKTGRAQYETMEAALQRELAAAGLAICDRRLAPGARYRHYKGGRYEIVGEATHSETGESLVVYRPVYGEGGLWVRPKAMFFETVTVDGAATPRFALLDCNPTGE